MFLWQRSSWSITLIKYFHPKKHKPRRHQLYEPSRDHWQGASEWLPEVVPCKRVKAALRAAFVSLCLLVYACLYSQTSFITSCGTGSQCSLATGTDAVCSRVTHWPFCQNKSFIHIIQSLKLRTRGAATQHVETRGGGAQRHPEDKASLLGEFRVTDSSAELVTLLPSLRGDAISQHGAQHPSEWSSLHHAAGADL